MEKQNIYPVVGLVWLICCVYQLKNSNMFMVVVSAVISVVFFALTIYTKNKNKESKNKNKKSKNNDND